MGHKVDTTWFRTRQEAESDQQNRGIRGYSERYPRGITEDQAADGTPIYSSTVEEFYG